MNKEFHYWLTGLIAKESGFTEEESKIIAYSSEYVDENDVVFTILNREGEKDYENYMSQTMNILKPKRQLMRIYPIFHFVPGEPEAGTARRRDGKRHILNTTPNSERANDLMDAAFNADDQTRLYRIGIATHAYLDTWAHQNFVGWFDEFNHIEMDLKPNVGHADAEHHPDWVSHRWVDNRLVEPEINNKLRFLSAARELFSKYRRYHGNEDIEDLSNRWADLETTLKRLQGNTYTGSRSKYEDERLENYRTELGGWLPEFNERVWFDTAIETDVRMGEDTHDGLMRHLTIFEDRYYWRQGINREDTHWYRFQEAVIAHQRFAMDLLTPVFDEMGIKLSDY
jgi:hypothetical protein